MCSSDLGYSLTGSYTPDLVFSKLWLARELKKVFAQQGIDSVPVAYVLGSWYSNLSTILRRTGVPIQKIVDVERNPKWLAAGAELQQDMNIDGVEQMEADANEVDYRQLGQPGVVINTSTNDIEGRDWYTSIPPGATVVLQGRDHQEFTNGVETLDRFNRIYPMDKTLYLGSLVVEGVDHDIYNRFMKIGIR